MISLTYSLILSLLFSLSSLSFSLFSLSFSRSITLGLVVMMRSKAFKTKIYSHADSLILSLSLSLSVSQSLCLSSVPAVLTSH